MSALASLPAESPAKLSAALLRVLLTSVSESLVIFDKAGAILLFNAGAERLFGYSSDEVLGMNFQTLVPLPGQASHGAFAGSRREVIAAHKDKSSFPVCLSVNRGEMDGEIIFVGLMNDLTDHNLDQDARRSKQRLQVMLDRVPDAIVTVDAAGKIDSFSSTATAMFGYDAGEIIGHPLAMLMPSPYRGAREDDLRRLRGKDKGDPVNGGRVVMGRRRDGSAFPMEITIGEAHDGDGHLFIIFIRDVTVRAGTEQRLEQLQSELLRVSRMDDMAHMTLAIAHELNQPLAAIANYVSALKRGLNAPQPGFDMMQSAHEMIDKASGETRRAAAILKGLRGFVEKREKTREAADLGQVIEEALALTFAGAHAVGVRVTLNFDPALPPVPMDRVQIQQVLFNLIRNSLEAMPPSGNRQLILSAEPSGGYAEVTVEDSGRGLAENIAAQLFIPFVTSKESGMGVGLTICQAIIEAHGGRLWLVRSSPDGTVFRFRLPLQPERSPR